MEDSSFFSLETVKEGRAKLRDDGFNASVDAISRCTILRYPDTAPHPLHQSLQFVSGKSESGRNLVSFEYP